MNLGFLSNIIIIKVNENQYSCSISGFKCILNKEQLTKLYNEARIALKESNESEYVEFKEDETTK